MLSLALLLTHAGSAILGSAFIASLGLTEHHRRHARFARYARDPGARIHEGPALVAGTVEEDEVEAPGPVLSVAFAPQGSDLVPRVHARPFYLRLPSGLALRVEPDADPAHLAIDQTYHAAAGQGYAAEVRHGDTICLAGDVRREINRRVTGRGYRDAATGWVLRAPPRGVLALVSSEMMALHAARARFHARWALRLGAVLVALQIGPLLAALGITSPLIPLVVGLLLAFMYREAALASRPWEERRVSPPGKTLKARLARPGAPRSITPQPRRPGDARSP